MQIARKAKHEAAIEAYGKKVAAMEVTLETRTGHAGRGFKKLLTLNDEEIQAIFDELSDEFLLEMELQEVNEAWDRLHEQTGRREAWRGNEKASRKRKKRYSWQLVNTPITQKGAYAKKNQPFVRPSLFGI